MLNQLYEKLETVAQHNVNAMLQPYLPKHATIEVILKGARQCSILVSTDVTDLATPWVCINLACKGEIVTSVQLQYEGEGLPQRLKVSINQPLVMVAPCLSAALEQLGHGNIDKAAHIIEHAQDYFAFNQFLRGALG